MCFPIKLVLGVAAGSIAAYFAVTLVFRLLIGLVGLILSLAIPLLVIGLLVYIVLRTVSPNALNMLRRLGR